VTGELVYLNYGMPEDYRALARRGMTGYGVKTLPAMREAIEANRSDEANRYAAVTAERLAAYADGIERATALISGGK